MRCRTLQFLLVLCAAIQVGYFLLGWCSLLPAGGNMQLSPSGMSFAAARALSPPQRLLGAGIGLTALLPMLYGLWRLNRMLVNVRRNAMFAASTIGHLRAFAGAMLASTLLSILEPPLRTLAYRYALGGHARGISVSASSSEVMLILLCGLFYLITSVMQEGRRLAEENEAFV